MWKKGKTLAVCMFAAAWWGVFYPELCFTEETCEAVQIEEADDGVGKSKTGKANEAAWKVDSGEIWRTDSEGIVISSRFLEWCEERLAARKEE